VVEHLAAKLELTSGQRQQLEQIKGEVQAKRAELQAHREESFEELLGLLQSERIDDTALKVAVAGHQARAHELIAFAGDKVREFHALLTPEQRAKLVAELREFRARGDHGCGWH
jgi:Spy/CpxP family protein refolding chaperone